MPVSPYKLVFANEPKTLQKLLFNVRNLQNEDISDWTKENKDKLESLKQLITSLKTLHNKFDEKRINQIRIMKDNFDASKLNPTLKNHDHVLIWIGDRNNASKKLHARFWGPFEVIRKLHHNTYRLKHTITKKELACHASKLKKIDIHNLRNFPTISEFEKYDEPTELTQELQTLVCGKSRQRRLTRYHQQQRVKVLCLKLNLDIPTGEVKRNTKYKKKCVRTLYHNYPP